MLETSAPSSAASPPPVPPYEVVAREYAAPIARLVRGYEADPDRQRDLLQEIQVALWRSLSTFDGRASLRTWVHKVAHNVAVRHVVRGARRGLERCVSVEELEAAASPGDLAREAEDRDTLSRVVELVRRLRPPDRQILLLYLEGFDHAEIAAVCGISPENAATKAHRIKRAITDALARGDEHAAR